MANTAALLRLCCNYRCSNVLIRRNCHGVVVGNDFHNLRSSGSAGLCRHFSSSPSSASSEKSPFDNTHNGRNIDASSNNNTMSWVAKWRGAVQKSQILLQDSFRLFRLLASNPSQTKQILLDSARAVDQSSSPNQVAIRLLKVEKEWNLIRYHGVSLYLQQYLQTRYRNNRFLSSLLNGGNQGLAVSTGGTGGNSNKNDDDDDDKKEKETEIVPKPTNSPKQAKIAFMITASMRNELQNTLGYSTEKIRAFTPLEASLILHHRIDPAEPPSKLAGFLEEHRKAAEAQAAIAAEEQQEEERLRELAAVEQQKNYEIQAARTTVLTSEKQIEPSSVPPSSSGSSFSSSSIFSGNSSFSSKNVRHEAGPSSSISSFANVSSLDLLSAPALTTSQAAAAAVLSKKSGVVWYEVVEKRRHRGQPRQPVDVSESGDDAAPVPEDDNEEEQVVGLYPKEDEAKLGAETFQFFSDRRRRESKKLADDRRPVDAPPSDDDEQHDLVYEVRKTIR